MEPLMTFTRIAILPLLLVTTACSGYNDKTDKSAEIALNKWADAIATRNTDNVLKLYDEDAVLLATFAKKPITTQEARKVYFDNLLKKKDLKVTIDELHTDREGDIALANGLYTFSYKDKGKTVKVPARFSFVFEEESNGWEIEAHHSSVQPK